MKTAILTFHRAHNYGAVLQCYALMKALEEIGADCEILDYSPQYFYNMYHIMPSGGSLKTKMLACACHVLLRKMIEKRTGNFDRFITDKLRLSDKIYRSQKDFESMPYESVIAGSDQIWHNKTAEFDPVFFMSTDAFRNIKKYSYAASFGMDSLPQELENDYRERLQGYRLMSVREESGVSIIQNLIGRTPVVSCDPTFLLSADVWKKLAGNKPVAEGKYIFLYYVKQPEKIRAYAKKLSEQLNCKVICCSCVFSGGNVKKYNYMSGRADRIDGFRTANSISPDKFLNLILHAEYVLCSSFHATVFSILFHKKFLSQTVWEDGKSNDRVKNLLDLTGLSDRTIQNENADIRFSIDWNDADKRIASMRKAGLEYLEEIKTNAEK